MTAKHTPGPWHVGMKPGPIIYGPNGEQVADLRAGAVLGGETYLDSRLIAATPDLLAALESLVKLHHDWDKGNAYVTVAFHEKNKVAIAAARAAIAKATGQ